MKAQEDIIESLRKEISDFVAIARGQGELIMSLGHDKDNMNELHKMLGRDWHPPVDDPRHAAREGGHACQPRQGDRSVRSCSTLAGLRQQLNRPTRHYVRQSPRLSVVQVPQALA